MDEAATAPAAAHLSRPAAPAAPTRLLALALVVVLAVMVGATVYAASQPWLASSSAARM